MKKFVCLLMSVSIIFFSTMTCYADVTDYIPDWLAYVVDTSQTIIGYDGTDQAFNDYISNSRQSSNYGFMVQALETMRPDPIVSELFPITKPYDVLISNTQSVYDGKFRAAVVNRDFVDRLYNNVSGYEGLASRYKSLDDYGIVTSENIDYNNNITIVDTWFTLDSKAGTSQVGFDGYIDISNAINYNGISLLSGNNCPPIMYIPPNHVVYHNGNAFSSSVYGLLCVLVDNVKLYFAYVSNYSSCSWYFYHYGNGIYDVQLASVNYDPYKTSYDRWYGHGFDANVYRNINGSGIVVNNGQDAYLSVQEMITQTGVLLTVDNTIPDIDPPDNIPYDDNGNTVIMIPIDNSNNVTYGDVYYISPTIIKNYYDNGDLTINNYTYDNDTSYINNTINNYYNYIINNDSSGYDDTALLNKLDIIIGKLADIYDFITFDGELTDIFSSEPVYDNFYDCIDEHLPVVNDTSQILSDVIDESDVDISIQDELDSWIIDDSDTDTDKLINLEHVPFDISWYERYRLKVRQLLVIGVYIFMVSYTITMYRRTFGLGGV